MGVQSESLAKGNRGRPLGRKVVGVALNIFTTLLALIFMFPFVWTVSSSLKRAHEVVSYPPRLIPQVPQWSNYYIAWTSIDFAVFFRNTTIITLLSVTGTLISCFAVAYGFARFDFPGRKILFLVCLSGMMMPVYVTIIPLFMMFRRIGWIDTFKPLIVPSWFGGAFGIFLMRQFIMTIPYELDESALLDGASRARILVSIILPNCKPALAVLAIFSFMANWNAFLAPLIFLDSTRNYTLALGLWFLRGYIGEPTEPTEHLLMAGSLIMTLPVILVFISAQRYFTEGVVMTGIKG